MATEIDTVVKVNKDATSISLFPAPVTANQEKIAIPPIIKPNRNPVVNFDISTVSRESFTAPVWLKFYPIGTYDPDGEIVLFEMDMNGDGIYDVKEKNFDRK